MLKLFTPLVFSAFTFVSARQPVPPEVKPAAKVVKPKEKGERFLLTCRHLGGKDLRAFQQHFDLLNKIRARRTWLAQKKPKNWQQLEKDLAGKEVQVRAAMVKVYRLPNLKEVIFLPLELKVYSLRKDGSPDYSKQLRTVSGMESVSRFHKLMTTLQQAESLLKANAEKMKSEDLRSVNERIDELRQLVSKEFTLDMAKRYHAELSHAKICIYLTAEEIAVIRSMR